MLANRPEKVSSRFSKKLSQRNRGVVCAWTPHICMHTHSDVHTTKSKQKGESIQHRGKIKDSLKWCSQIHRRSRQDKTTEEPGYLFWERKKVLEKCWKFIIEFKEKEKQNKTHQRLHTKLSQTKHTYTQRKRTKTEFQNDLRNDYFQILQKDKNAYL